MADYRDEIGLSNAGVNLCEMQAYSEPPHSIIKASHQPRRHAAKHEKNHAVQRVVAARMKKSESKYIAQRQKRDRTRICPVCGSALKGKQGCCVNCGTVIDGPAPGTNYALRPMLPMDRLLFLHLDVESGKVSYIESNGDHGFFGEVDLKEERNE